MQKKNNPMMKLKTIPWEDLGSFVISRDGIILDHLGSSELIWDLLWAPSIVNHSRRCNGAGCYDDEFLSPGVTKYCKVQKEMPQSWMRFRRIVEPRSHKVL